ncbi:MAG: helix-turn-helix transcriptional regulator [Bacteroidales bacterium]|nr:helix-turn-helix transcriptional regulator [Bacteroidales bacterium]
METTVKQRLMEYLRFKQVNMSEFGRLVGVSNAYVTSIKRSISPDKLQAIASNFPDLDIQWLVTGEGQMIKAGQQVGDSNSGVIINGNNRISNSPIDNRQYYSDSPDVLKAQIELLDERIKEKDAQIKEKDAQIKQLLDILAKH